MKMFSQQCLFVLALAIVAVSAQQSCTTPSNTPGRCVPYLQCTYVKKIFDNWGPELPTNLKDFLVKSRCIGDPSKIYLCCDLGSITEEATTTVRTVKRTTTTTTTTSVSNADYVSTLNPKGLELLRSMKCGSLSGDRVAFGEETGLAEFPWMALIRYDTEREPFKCGGSLITSRYVLTAAHCHVGNDDNIIGVRLGEHDISKERDCERKGTETICSPPVEDIGIDKIISHPKYSRQYYLNDVALIKLDRNVNFQRHIKPICLPISQSSIKLAKDQEYFIAGWGTTEIGTTSKVLLKAKIAHRDIGVCQKTYTRATITDNHICAGGGDRFDSCKGDSGGPLFFLAPYERTQRYVQFGIVSFGSSKCGDNTAFPGIYSNIIQLMPWLTSNID